MSHEYYGWGGGVFLFLLFFLIVLVLFIYPCWEYPYNSYVIHSKEDDWWNRDRFQFIYHFNKLPEQRQKWLVMQAKAQGIPENGHSTAFMHVTPPNWESATLPYRRPNVVI
jgi:hypothetical protein